MRKVDRFDPDDFFSRLCEDRPRMSEAAGLANNIVDAVDGSFDEFNLGSAPVERFVGALGRTTNDELVALIEEIAERFPLFVYAVKAADELQRRGISLQVDHGTDWLR